MSNYIGENSIKKILTLVKGELDTKASVEYVDNSLEEGGGNALQKTGDTMEGILKFTEGVHYGEQVPETGEEGQIFFHLGESFADVIDDGSIGISKLGEDVIEQLDKKLEIEDVRYKIYNYYDLAKLGLSGEITTDQIFTALPAQSKLLLAQSINNATSLTDLPISYAAVELTKTSANYGYGTAVQVASTSVDRYTYTWYNGSDVAGAKYWVQDLNGINNIVIEKATPYMYLKNTSTERQTLVGTVADNITVLYNAPFSDSDNNRAGLWIGAENFSNENLLRLQKKVDGTSTTYNVFHSGISAINANLGQCWATCSTAAATAEKTVTMSSYTLKIGGMVAIKFTNAVPASATMNINSNGAKPIYYRGSAIAAGVINAGDTATFIYNGTNYILLAVDSGTLKNALNRTTSATAADTNYTTAMMRAIKASTTDLTANTSTLTSGQIYLVYE